ncbi:MAG: uroporphyrinogen-III synthase [Rudaea sp.]
MTRPTATAATLKRRVRELGANAISLPGLVLKITDDVDETKTALVRARQSDVVIFVSPAAVRFAFELQSTLRFVRASTIIAIGNATARALERRGVSNVHRPSTRQDSEGVLGLPELAHVRGKHVSLIGADGGRGLLSRTLRQRRAKVEPIHVYRRCTPRYNRSLLAKLEQAPTPLVTLLSSAEVLMNLRSTLPLHLYARLAAGELIVSSKRLAIVAGSHLFAHVHIADSAAPADLLRTACDALSRHRL